MTTVPPPTSNPLLQQVAASAAPLVMILQPPPAVAALPPGAILEGVVLPQSSSANSSNSNPKADSGGDDNTTDARGDARASVTIRTAAGDVTVRLPTPLPAGSDVELQVVRAGPDQAALRLVAVDGQPAAQVLAQLRQAANTAAPVPAQPQPTATPAATTALPLTNAWTPLGPVTLPTLGPISAYVTQGTPPLPAANVPLATGPLAANPLAAGATPAATPAASPPVFTLLTGGDLALRVTAVELPTTPQSMSAPPSGVGPVPTPPALNVPATSGAAPLTGAVPASTPPSSVPSPSPTPVGATPPLQNAVATPSAAQPLNGNPLFTAPAAPTSAPAVTAPALGPVLGSEPKPALAVAGPGGLEPPPPAPPSTSAPPPQATLTGVVIANDARGTPIILTDLGQIQLNVRANLPVGTRITFDITAQEPPLPGSTPPPAPITSLPLSGPPLGLQAGGAAAGWPNLSEALTQLQKSDPAAAAQFAAAIPDGGPRSLVAMIAFAQAMRMGDTRRWPGDDNLRALERTGPRGAHLAAQIGDEVSALSTKARDAAGPEWRAMPVPWNADGRIDRIALITRREGDPDSEAGKKSRSGGTRFLVNLDLSRLGPLQLDGMFRRETRGFDLMVRTKETLPDDLRLELTGVFANATSAVGLKGGLTFHVTRTFPDPTGSGVSLDKSGVWA